MDKTQWDENLVMHEGMAHKLDEMTPPELFALGERLRTAVTQIEGQIADGHSPDEDWYRRARAALSIKQRQIVHIDDLLAEIGQAATRVAGNGGGRPARPAATMWTQGNTPVTAAPVGKSAAKTPSSASYFVMAARVILHPSMFAAIEEQAARLAAGESG